MIKLTILLFTVSILTIILFNYNILCYYHFFTCYDFMCKCRKYIISKNRTYYKQITNGTQLWNILLNQSLDVTCYFFKNMILKKNNTFFYNHRVYRKYITNISVKGSFPDKSYSRLIPSNKIDYTNVISHTYEVQKYIYNHQHPLNCDNKKFIIIKGYGSGHGSEIHVMTSYLALALELDRIAIIDPYTMSAKAYGDYCKEFKNWLCFLEQLTNCSLNKYDILSAKNYVNINQTDKYIMIGGSLKYRNIIPYEIVDTIKYSPLARNKYIHFWRIQASTYIFRLNKRTNNEVEKIMYKSFNNKLNNGCFNIWIRHGDKYKEMKLLNAEDYIPSFELYIKMTGKKIPIYLSTDDPNVTKYFDNYRNVVTYYLNFSRKNENFYSNMKRGAEMTLNFIADIKAALYCNSFSGTRSSNVVRLIDELRSTVGLSANAFYFENGLIKLSDTSYEYTEYW